MAVKSKLAFWKVDKTSVSDGRLLEIALNPNDKTLKPIPATPDATPKPKSSNDSIPIPSETWSMVSEIAV